METFLKEINDLPGVQGACIFNKNKIKTLAILPPSAFTENIIEETARNVARMALVASAKGMDPQTVSIRYDNIDLLAISIDETLLLLTICEPGTNSSLIATTAKILAPEMGKK